MINPHTCAYETRPLVELCEINIGKTPARANSEYWGVGSPWLSIRDMNQGRIISETSEMITESAINECGCKEVPANTVLMSFKLSIGKVGITKVPLYTNEAIVALPILDPSILDLGFLYHTLKNFDFEKAGGNRAVMGITLNKKSLSTLQIPLPPLSEQKRIAEILDCADAIRRTRQETLKTCDELLRSTFLEMFGDPVTNPMGWEVRELGEVLTNIKDGPHVSPKYADEGVPILSTRNIRPGKLLMENVKFVSDITYQSLTQRFCPKYGDVLLTKGGTTGFAKSVDWDWPFAIWVHLACLRPNQSVLLPEYLEMALNSPNCYAQSQKYTHGVTNKDLGLKRIAKIQMAIPPIERQRELIEVKQTIDTLEKQKMLFIEQAEDLFNSLVQRAFRGEL